MPGRSWMLQTDHIYNIHVEIFDKESRKIYPSEVCYVWYDHSCIFSRATIESIEHKRVLVQTCRLAHLSVCLEGVLWHNGSLDLDAIWGGEWVWLRYGWVY